MTTLYFRNGTCALGPHIALEWMGASYEAVVAPAGSAELLAMNASGAVPVLKEDDGWVLTQAGAILRYLLIEYPDSGLGGEDGARGQAELERWICFLTGDLHPAFFPVFMPDRYTTDQSDDAKAKVVEAGIGLVRKNLRLLDAQLEGKEWILGPRSVADAYAFPMIRWARAKLPDGLAAYTNVLALYDRLAADPAVQRTLKFQAEAKAP